MTTFCSNPISTSLSYKEPPVQVQARKLTVGRLLNLRTLENVTASYWYYLCNEANYQEDLLWLFQQQGDTVTFLPVSLVR